MHDAVPAAAVPIAARWQPLASVDRRVLGVLIEKAKTTPENYPLSLNALRTGCNQKSNRAPVMQLEEEQMEAALDSLRHAGAVAVIEGSGRVDKYRHLAYDWLGVDKVELAVMAELLLRGAQTVGELRGRAARMEPIKDLGALQPVLDALDAKRLIIYLTPPGRGAMVTHALHENHEVEKLRRKTFSTEPDDDAESAALGAAKLCIAPPDATNVAAELGQLREELAAAKRDFAAGQAEFESTAGQLRRDLDALNRQLGN